MPRLSPTPLGFVPPALPSGFYVQLHSTHATGTAGMTNNVFRCMPIFLPYPISFSRIGLEVTTAGEAGSLLRLGAYADDGLGRPGALIQDFGTVLGSAAGEQALVLSGTLPAGLLWVGAAAHLAPTTVPTVRTNGAGSPAPFPMLMPGAGTFNSGTYQGYQFGAATGPLPSAAGSVSPTGSYVPRIHVKTA